MVSIHASFLGSSLRQQFCCIILHPYFLCVLTLESSSLLMLKGDFNSCLFAKENDEDEAAAVGIQQEKEEQEAKQIDVLGFDINQINQLHVQNSPSKTMLKQMLMIQ